MSEHTNTDSSSTTETRRAPDAVNVVEPFDELVAGATTIAVVTVTSADPNAVTLNPDGGYPAQSAELQVLDVLAGTVGADSIEVTKPAGAYFLTAEENAGQPDARHHGIVFLDDSSPAALLGYLGVHSGPYDLRRTVRTIAGLPPDEPAPTDEEIHALADRADAVVLGYATGRPASVEHTFAGYEFSSEADLQVASTLAGQEVTGTISVRRGDVPDSPGGPWGFRTDTFVNAVYFLDLSTEPPTVLNPSEPSLYPRWLVEPALD